MFLTIKLINYIKIDLALNNLQRLICHKTQQTKPNQSNLKQKKEHNIIIRRVSISHMGPMYIETHCIWRVYHSIMYFEFLNRSLAFNVYEYIQQL